MIILNAKGRKKHVSVEAEGMKSFGKAAAFHSAKEPTVPARMFANDSF